MSQSSEPAAASRVSQEFFRERFGVDERSLDATLAAALEREVDHADLYFEYTTQDAVSLEEGIVKSGERHLEQGVGVRVVSGERQGYAHSDEIQLESLRLAATTARAICERPGRRSPVALSGSALRPHDLYPVALAPTDVPVDRKVDLLGEMDAYARSLDARVKQVMASVVCQHRQLLVATSDGQIVGDVQPLVRLNVQVIAARGERREMGYHGMGGRYEFERLLAPESWRPLVAEAVRIA